MPTPVACLLNNPETTFNRGRSEANGWRLLLSCMSAPDPLAPQFFGLMPLPMNSAAKRLGCTAGEVREVASLPPTGIDSSHGRPIVTPTPRRNVRRLSLCGGGFIVSISGQVPAVESRKQVVFYSPRGPSSKLYFFVPPRCFRGLAFSVVSRIRRRDCRISPSPETAD